MTAAQAGELKLWTDEQYKGDYIAFSFCTADFEDNIYDSGTQNLAGWVTIWNNTVVFGDKAIAKIYKSQTNPSFGALNQSDHATCYG